MATEDMAPAVEGRTVFVSYARVDRPHAASLIAALEAAGCVVWWDDHIEAGAQFARSIERALTTCDVVIVLWSRAAVASDWVLDEAAVGRDRQRLVPVTLDGTPPPLGFGQYHALDFTDWQGDSAATAVQRLLRAVASTSEGRRDVDTLAAVTDGAADMPMPTRRRVLIGAVVAAPLAALVAWRLGAFGDSDAANDASIAVLPFANSSGSDAQDYLASGVAEEVRITLAMNGAMRVLAEASSTALARSAGAADRTVQQLANSLGVGWLLDGSVRRAGDRLRISAELIDGSTGFSRWAQLFERSVADIFVVQRDIADAVTTAVVRHVVTPTHIDATARSGGTRNVAAYDAYLAGRALYELGASETTERAALERFDAAVALDARYAAAHVGRARALASIASQYAKSTEHPALTAAALAAAQHAVVLAPEFADAHSALGLTLFQGKLDARSARAPFERSRVLGAGNASVISRYAMFAARVTDHAAASAAIERALLLDPLNAAVHRAAGAVAHAARRYAAALTPLRRALALNPRLAQAHSAIGHALLMLGRLTEAKAAFAHEPLVRARLTGLAIVERRLGDADAARTALRTLETDHGDDVLYERAQVQAAWGNATAALALLERARVLGDAGLVYLHTDPLFDGVRTQPRFVVLLRSLGFD